MATDACQKNFPVVEAIDISKAAQEKINLLDLNTRFIHIRPYYFQCF